MPCKNLQNTPKNSQFSTMHTSSSKDKNSSLDMADYVGVESHVDLKLAPYKWFNCSSGGGGLLLKKEKKKEKIEREYPPPLPCLARTENIPSSQMPWVMKRYHTPDGRLIIKEEKVKRFEYFEAHRIDGRLMLNLVPLNDDVSDSDGDDDETDGCDQGKVDQTAVENGSALMNGGIKCSSLCTFGVAVPPIRPVHT
ncbi:uncharacterized protein LOC132035406 [Lycium ferocissimum]|uniref:uncharacterized protein LOC132035406 n=1 Tax=Lycium ferocissimum TaxID=112874 RepID=UPI00281658D5|nr:uncharacterized protein LOC132035406 [Lycium ferocissimum]